MRIALHARSAFTLVELMVVCAIAMLLGGVAYIILNSGLVLFSKNTSMNVAHQEARMAMMQLERELHRAVSPTQLIDQDGAPVSGNGPAAGISFQTFAAGPFEVTAKADSGQNKVTMDLGSRQAKASQRLVIASHEVEIDIAEDSSGTGNQVVTLEENLPHTINIEMDDAGTMIPVHVVGLLTDRVSYLIKDGELQYRDPQGRTIVLARDITSDKPFSQPKKGTANPTSRSIAAVNLTTGTKGAKKRKYKSANMFLNAEVPARAFLCTKP
jgi:hypothetical protein